MLVFDLLPKRLEQDGPLSFLDDGIPQRPDGADRQFGDVPVAITSPRLRGMKVEQYSMMKATSQIMSKIG
jgi:hypothetical protein